MSNLFNLSDYPTIMDTINEAATKLIEETDKADFKNPLLECEIKVEDGRIYKIVFERIDLF